MSKIDIFGRNNCPYCIKAHELAKNLKDKLGFNFTYTDIIENNITKEDLAKKAGVEVNTVPQIWLNDKHIGGYTDLVKILTENGTLKKAGL